MLSAIDLFWGYKNPMGWMFILVRASTSLQGIVYLIIFGLHQKNFVRLQRKYPRLRGTRAILKYLLLQVSFEILLIQKINF